MPKSILARQVPEAANREKTRVAVLSVCCDDIDTEALQLLERFRDVDVFILDDSEEPAAQRLVDESGFTVVRRGGRAAFKAGNLNHWLHLYGATYRYCLVLDSDSVLTNDVLWQLVSCAEHPANADVGIVQASIVPRAGNCFQTGIAAFASMRRAISLRVHARIGWTLSEGHNNLHRIVALRQIGGFDTSASCEDTLTSLRMCNSGWRTVLIEAAAFDAEPLNAFSYRRRSVRWARQTLDVILAYRGGTDPRLCLLLAKHLYSHVRAALMPFLLMPVALTSLRAEWCCVADLRTYSSWMNVAGLSLPLGLLSLFLLRLLFWWRVNGTPRGFVTSSLLSGTVATFSSLHILVGLSRSLLLGQTRFIATGTVCSERLAILRFLNGMKFAILARCSLMICFLRIDRIHLSLMTINIFILIVVPAVILWWYHRDQGIMLF